MRGTPRSKPRTVAALFVEEGGVYEGLQGVDLWPLWRDARKYRGPYPVVAHPPCSRWCRLAGLVEAQYGYKRGQDGGCFASALRSVRCYGGVLEHPAYSDAWKKFGLPEPYRQGGWSQGPCGGWSCYVEQGRYGHSARKATWLYVYGTRLPLLAWGSRPDSYPGLVSWCGGDGRPRMSGKKASRTPVAFRDLLLFIARTARVSSR
jgi:hypothetical protein